MNKILAAALTFSLLFLNACSTYPHENDTKIVRFALRDDNIASWEEKGDGIAVHLNNEGRRKLVSITRNNPGSEMEIYAGRIFLTSSVIHNTLKGDNLYVEIDNDDVKDQVLAMLPQSKKT